MNPIAPEPDSQPTGSTDPTPPPVEPSVPQFEQPQQPAQPEQAPVEPQPAASVDTTPGVFNPFSSVSPSETTPVPEATPATAPSAPVSPVSPKSKKPLIISAILGGVVLLAGIAAVLFFTFFNVTKQDYAAAAEQYNNVRSANSKLASDIPSLTSTSSRASDTEFNNAVASVETDLTALKTENETFGKLKAVKVGEGSKLYNSFNSKLTAYLAYGTDLVTSIKAVRPALVACGEVSNAKDTTSRVTALKKCSTTFSEVGAIPNAEFKTYIDTVKVKYAEYSTAYESISALTNPYGTQYDQYKTLRDKIYAIQDDISKASKEFSANQDKHEAELSIKDNANALVTYLNDQQK